MGLFCDTFHMCPGINRNANIGTAGTPGNLSITPIWIRMTVPGVPNISGKKILIKLNI